MVAVSILCQRSAAPKKFICREQRDGQRNGIGIPGGEVEIWGKKRGAADGSSV